MKNFCLVLREKDEMKLEERPLPEPKAGEVQLSIRSVGICGSDVSYLRKMAIGDFIVKKPMILGHEASGIVTKLGPGVQNLKVGDRVAVEPGVPCKACQFCKIGRYNLCKDVVFLATPPVDGCIANFHCHASDFCYNLPDNVSLEEGALIEPLSVGVHACKRAGVTFGDSVQICGAGAIGLVSMLVAKSMGAAKICVTDIAVDRLKRAKQMGATHTLLIKEKDPKKVAELIKEKIGEPRVTIECSGAESSIQTAIYATKSGGTVVLVGMGPAQVNIPILDAAIREVDIRGIFRYANTYREAIEMVARGDLDVKQLVTHRFQMEESQNAFDSFGKEGVLKVVINCESRS
ncbi:DgyrCDS2354 [Dimorphilus gyrociliatus]|uniref:Sorbitol dehydrogenase n=1 Tax=Dimorphilus gyrociliatus TaxID=2664684 RepID=A0A7I8VCT9_9ANNE|nr:DgyrCDS2354 [Dimorphilus gyrociliatus]